MAMVPLLLQLLLVWSSRLVKVARAAVNVNCKSIPGDSTWPTQSSWDQLNQTVGGRLIATVPRAAVCYSAGYASVQANEAQCAALKKDWDMPKTFVNAPGEIMNPWYQNGSCNPFYQRSGGGNSNSSSCELGNYASYSIDISGPDDVVAGLDFARKNKVRLVIKNTGHDYMGKSTGRGSLALWTHNLQSMEVLTNYSTKDYTGPAIRIGAGVSGGQAILKASSHGFRIVSGDCPTVGIAGGYSAGGGHGLLNGMYGLAADNVLEWEVVTANGTHTTATNTMNRDLYWALSGGGAGTYAVVLSMTAKLHAEDGRVGAATLDFNVTSSPDNTTYARALAAWWQFLPNIVDSGAAPAFNFLSGGFLVYNTTAPGKTAQEMTQLYAPYLARLDELGVKYTFNTYTAPSYVIHYNATNGPLPDGPYTGTSLFNSRLIPRAVSTNPGRADALVAAMILAMDHDVAGANWQVGCMGLNVSNTAIVDNGVSPYWRSAVAICLEFSLYNWTVPESVMVRRRRDLATLIHPVIEAATPESGAYLNEADPLVYPKNAVAKWQSAFYGTNYQRLRVVKDTWDPEGIFYALCAVGSEKWVEDGDGRICGP